MAAGLLLYGIYNRSEVTTVAESEAYESKGGGVCVGKVSYA